MSAQEGPTVEQIRKYALEMANAYNNDAADHQDDEIRMFMGLAKADALIGVAYFIDEGWQEEV